MPPTLPARCRHLHADGRQCGSPALRGQPLCFQHRASRQPLPCKTLEGRFIPQLPVPDDFLSIQRGIAEVLRLLAEEEITESRASTLLRGLSNASQNLARTLREQRRQQAEAPSEPVTDLVNHPEYGPLALEDSATPIQQNQDLGGIDENKNPSTAVILSVAKNPYSSSSEPAPSPAPEPANRLAPYADNTMADDFRNGQRFQRLQTSFREQREAFIKEKSAELEAQFALKLEQAIANELVGHRLQHEPQPELHLVLAC